jgi:hypothetical protein
VLCTNSTAHLIQCFNPSKHIPNRGGLEYEVKKGASVCGHEKQGWLRPVSRCRRGFVLKPSTLNNNKKAFNQKKLFLPKTKVEIVKIVNIVKLQQFFSLLKLQQFFSLLKMLKNFKVKKFKLLILSK